MVNDISLGINNGNTKIPMGFGAIPRRKDPRDFNLGSYQIPAVIPSVFMPDISAFPVYMQGTYPTCGAHAGAFKASLMKRYRHEVTVSLSPKYLWDEIKQIDGFPLEDGTDMTSIFRSIASTGVCDLNLLSNDLGASLNTYSNIHNVTDSMEVNAAENLVRNYAFINNPTMAQIKESIYINKAVVALIDIGDGFWLPDWKHVLPLKLGNPVGHHFIVLWGYDETKIWFRNSWSNLWGINGDGYFDSTYIPHVLEIGSVIFLPNQFIFTKDLQRGDSNNDVIQIQRRIGVVPDSGWFGPITLAAVKKYQTAHNIPATGFVGPRTRQELNMTI